LNLYFCYIWVYTQKLLVLGYSLCNCLRNHQLLCTASIPFYFSSHSAQGFYFFAPSPVFIFYFLIEAIPMSVRLYLIIVLICISLVITNVNSFSIICYLVLYLFWRKNYLSPLPFLRLFTFALVFEFQEFSVCSRF
jgi:hypothetical protein